MRTQLCRAACCLGLVLTMTAPAWALNPPPTPEIDGGSAASAVALLFGTLMLFNARRRGRQK